jgi:hypothetical protein
VYCAVPCLMIHANFVVATPHTTYIHTYIPQTTVLTQKHAWLLMLVKCQCYVVMVPKLHMTVLLTKVSLLALPYRWW